jgi:hypothetical protein
MMNLCIAGASKKAEALRDAAIKGNVFNPTAFSKFEMENYTDRPDRTPAGMPLLSVDEIRRQIDAGALDGVCVPHDNYYQVRIAMINEFKTAGVHRIFVASCDESGMSPKPFGLPEKTAYKAKKVLRIAINVQHAESRNGTYLRRLIEDSFDNVFVSCFTSWNDGFAGKRLDGLGILPYSGLPGLFAEGGLDGVLFSQKDNPLNNQNARDLLRKREWGGMQLFMTDGNIFHKPVPERDDIERIFGDYTHDQIGKVDVMTTDRCNLNCQGCILFCSLFDGRTKQVFWKYDSETFRSDLDNLHRLLGDKISKISFLGGEPFLHPLLGDFVAYAREVYPHMDIFIVTNGLLLPKADARLLEIIRDCSVWIAVSSYPPTRAIKTQIEEALNAYGIYYQFGSDVNVFLGRLNPSGGYEPRRMYDLCWDKYCYMIRNGKLAGCPFIMLTDRFNIYFDEALSFCPEGAVDLCDTDISEEDVLRRLRTPNELCRFCNRKEHEWYPWTTVSDKADIRYWLSGDDMKARHAPSRGMREKRANT